MTVSKKDKKSALLSIARKILNRYGPSKITLDDIAQASGMSVSSLYYYFPSKSELLREVLIAEHQEFLRELRKRISAVRGPEAKLAELSRLLFEKLRYLSRLPGMTHAERVSIFVEVEQAAQKFKQRFIGTIEQILMEGKRMGVFEVERPKIAARAFAAGLRGIADTVLDGEFPEDDIDSLQNMFGLFIRGLKKR